VRRGVAGLAAVLCLAACGGATSIPGSSVTSVTIARPNALGVGDGASRLSAPSDVSQHPGVAVDRPANGAPVAPASRPVPVATANPETAVSGLSCRSIGPGRVQPMCAPQ